MSVVKVQSDWKSTAIIAGVAIVGLGIVIYVAYKGAENLAKWFSGLGNWFNSSIAQPFEQAGAYLSQPLGGVPLGLFDITGLGGIADILQKLITGSQQKPTYAPNAQAMYTALKPSQQWYTSLAQQYGGSTGITYSLPEYPSITFYMSPAQEFMA